MHFQSRVIKFFSDFIPQFDKEISEIKTNNVLPSVPKWKFTTFFPLKTFLNEHQYIFPFQNMAKIMPFHPPNNEKMSQFHFSYMTNRTLREQEIKMMTSASSINTIKCIKTAENIYKRIFTDHVL